jgi:hypothetical protein
VRCSPRVTGKRKECYEITDMDKLEWLKEIDIRPYLSEDALIIVEEIGAEKFYRLSLELNHVRFRFSSANLMKLKKEFIRQNRGRYTVSEFAELLGVSKGFVYKAVKKWKM